MSAQKGQLGADDDCWAIHVRFHEIDESPSSLAELSRMGWAHISSIGWRVRELVGFPGAFPHSLVP